MQSSKHLKEKSVSSQIRRGRSAATRSIIEGLETDKESVISDYEERGSQRSNTYNPNDELSRSFSSINQSFLQQKAYSTNESELSQSSTASFHSDDPYVMTASVGRMNSNNVLKRNAGMLTSSTRMNRRAHLTGNKQAIQSATSSQVDESSFCTSQLDDYKQKGNGLFFDEDIDDFEDEAEEQDLTPEERALMEKWMHVFQRMLKNRIKEEDAFEYLLEEELSLAQFGWNHSATILATISKIYSLKVDRLCHESYHLLASLARGSTKTSQQQMEESNAQSTNNLASNEKRRKHEEEKEGNIVNGSFGQFLAMYEGGQGDQRQVMKSDRTGQLNRIDMEFEVDPLFRKTSVCFDSSSSSGLLLNILPLQSEIVMTLGEIEIKENTHCNNLMGSSTNERGGGQDQFKNSDSSIWKKMKRAAAEIASIESWDVLPELMDFKITVNQEQEQFLNSDRAFNISRAMIQATPSSSFFLQTQRNSNSNEKGYAGLIHEGQSEDDKKLMDEIEQMLTQDTLTTHNRIEQVTTALKGRTSVGANKITLTPDMQTPMNTRQGGRGFEDTLHAQNLSQIDHFDHDISFGSLGSADSQSSSSQGFDSQSLNSSIHKLGRGDKTILSPVCMNLNWGDPKQWEIQKPVVIGRLTKKTKLKQNADGALGAIREDLMEAEDPNDRHNLNAQYNQLTRQSPRLIEFDIDLDNAEDFNVVMACKKTKKRKNKKKKGSLRIRKIVDRNQIQKDHRITTDKVFGIGLRSMKEAGMPRLKVYEGQFMGDMFDLLDGSFSHRGVSDQKEEGFEFDDGFGRGDRESARKANRRVSLLGSAITPFDALSANDLSPARYGGEFEYRTAMKLTDRQFFSQTQTAAKRNLKIQELKETVWTCMTASKNSQEYPYSLQPLSQFTAKKESPVEMRQTRRKNQRSSTGSVQSAVSAEQSFASIVLEQNGLEGSIKFTDVMTQVSGGYSEATLVQAGVSIQNCFISLLHLANEKQLRLIDPSHTEAEFFIFEDDQEGQNQKMEELS